MPECSLLCLTSNASGLSSLDKVFPCHLGFLHNVHLNACIVIKCMILLCFIVPVLLSDIVLLIFLKYKLSSI